MLKTDTLNGLAGQDTIVVRDTEGGIWWPNEDALAEINASDDPEVSAIEICENEPMRGVWKQ